MTFLPQEIIRRKRDSARLSAEEIEAFVAGIAEGSLSEGQIAAFAMAVFLNGMTPEETVTLTRAMTASGRRIDWREANLPGPMLDKHSTGGVGDKVSLVLAPVLAACGAFVPMISGRGLGHTGGTLDKLDSIPGYDTAPDIARFQQVVAEAGCAIIGQTADLAPADKRLYAVRDVTATVESIPLITASILSKKLAAGLDALVMDVKAGNGAFAATPEMARDLSESIVSVATGAGLPTTALITDMNQPLGRSAGNALEVWESVELLTSGQGDPRLREVTLALAAEMLLLGKLADDGESARTKAEDALASGRAAERFGTMVAALGGPADFLARAGEILPRAPVRRAVQAKVAGVVGAVDTRAVGLAVIELGGGRRRVEDAVDPAVGIDEIVPLGQTVSAADPLAVGHPADEAGAEAAAGVFQKAFQIGETGPEPSPVVHQRITAEDV
ncbi:thymidine phosphorylase [Pelagibius marinus]|uniref:thymidine phosphorylase n=1 Tax=Pelagibius marinus TaxID=2762760 RepID=UPI00187244C2|nr:thymidine phosphorylase [Pelagibius marinus]